MNKRGSANFRITGYVWLRKENIVSTFTGFIDFQSPISKTELGKQESILSQGWQIKPSSHAFFIGKKENLSCWESTSWTIWLHQTGSRTVDRFDQIWQDDPFAALEQLQSSFILIAFEKSRQRFWIARDPIGLQRLYWSRKGSQLYLSSDLKSLAKHPSISPQLADEHLAEYLSFRYIHAPRTLYKNIFSLPAGHVLLIDQEKYREDRWYRPEWKTIDQNAPTLKQAGLELDLILRRSVEKIILSNQRTGVLLSGGLDSSAILYHASQMGQAPDSFTVILDNERADESPFASRIAHLYHSQNHLLRVSSEQFIEQLHLSTSCMGHPLPTAAGAIQHLLFQFSKDYVDSLISGDGGDEVLAGRSMPQLVRRLNQVHFIEKLPYVSRRIIRGLAKRSAKKDWAASYMRFGQDRSIGGSRVFLAPDRVALLADPGLVRSNIRRRILTPFYQEVDSDPINNILHVWQRGWLVEDSLFRVASLSSDIGLSIHLPMLNKQLVEYCARLPGDYKIRSRRFNHISKWLLRESMKARIPKRLLDRPKRTWLHPLDTWLKNDGQSFLAKEITQMSQQCQHIFAPDMLHRLYREHTQGQHNHGLKLWNLLLFHLWWKEFINR